MGWRIRVGGGADVAAVVALEWTTVQAPHWAEVEYAAIVDGGGGTGGAVRRCLFVADAEGKVAGFAVGKVIVSGDGSIAEIESVAVELAARRDGMGRALCEALIEWSRGMGATEVELEVREGSAGAIALYAGLGFVVVGRRARYYEGPAEDAVLMRLELCEAVRSTLPVMPEL